MDIKVERLNVRPTTNTAYAVAIRTQIEQGVFPLRIIDYDELDGLIQRLQVIAHADHCRRADGRF